LLIRRNKDKKKKERYRPPTVEEMLQFRPRRAEYEWITKEDGLVEITVPKFESNFGKSFCSIIKKDTIFKANMDKIGSIVWKNSDGEKTVRDILALINKEYPNEDNIQQRLFLFVQQMGSLGYITY